MHSRKLRCDVAIFLISDLRGKTHGTLNYCTLVIPLFPFQRLEMRSKVSLVWNHRNVTNCRQRRVGFQHENSGIGDITVRN